MTSQSPRPAGPSLNLRGAVDLGALAARRQASAQAGAAGAGAGAGAPGSFVIDTTEATFTTDVVELSMTVPVVIDFWADWCGPCTASRSWSRWPPSTGQVPAGWWDADANPQLTAAFQVQASLRCSLWQGQPVPPFQALKYGPGAVVLEKQLRWLPRTGSPAGSRAVPHGGHGGGAGREPLPPLCRRPTTRSRRTT